MQQIAKILQISLFLIIISGLTGCAISPTKIVSNPIAVWNAHEHYMDQVSCWQIQGVIGVKLKDQSFSANYNWQQTQAHYQINLYGPLGLASTEIAGSDQMVTLTLHDGKVLTADNLQDLLQQNLGWQMPVLGMVYWVRGIPVPNLPVLIKLNSVGLPAEMQQQGWDINYENYQIFNHQLLPHKIRFQQAQLTLTMIINAWNF